MGAAEEFTYDPFCRDWKARPATMLLAMSALKRAKDNCHERLELMAVNERLRTILALYQDEDVRIG